LKEKGIENAAALLGGTAAWENAGYPMEPNAENAPNNNKGEKSKPDNSQKSENKPKSE
jgi:3-mercaptopyruvate sulfurtransferase SseA